MTGAFCRPPLLVRSRLRKLASCVSVVVLLGLAESSAPVSAAQKTVAICRQEWRGTDQARWRTLGLGEKDYIERCRKGEPVVFGTNMPRVPRPAIPGQSTMPLAMPPAPSPR